MRKRVVITGLGVVSPNGVGLDAFTNALKNGSSGIRHSKVLEELQFSCQVAGEPIISDLMKEEYLTRLQLRGFNSTGILYGVIAGIDAFKDAGLKINADEVDWDMSIIFGAGTSGIDKFREAIYKVDEKNVRRLGSSVAIQVMNSGVSAYLSGILGAGGQVTTNSSACTTGAESILMGYDLIQSGRATKVLTGSTSDSGPYIWGGFDAMKVCAYKFNDQPEKASRPMSESANGFVPGSGAGALMLETLDSALERGATIYAELLGGHVNCGAQRNGGSLTAPNNEAVQRCIKTAVKNAGINAQDISTINGHLTATKKDSIEVQNWKEALEFTKDNFPPINSLKSLVGHGLSASGALESVASVLQIKEQFVFPNANCEDIHPDIEAMINSTSVPTKMKELDVDIVAKASFGFGDVNGCLIFKRYNHS
ncbi:beta-ketoacyl-[acyl-carrier-protein] synthase family protein [Spongiivirga citrea]|uniref:3-oxoacyl-[acyl-carrier-protein] synthase 1 n=1 Tax=Spongiivirga citrea TaxID=1481457 RepID=A0A6M0CD43_9FLAO|nr:beta-ketoacyl-[acyl-carrier-protein] synthase family protein [Spongiivirga citrea]NER15621.1 beta-ketoacyl-[acyl-carrier-protein] synthase family protein [Spongiivirga citrea]